MRTTAGYIRRSHAGEAAVSEKVQREAIARLAEANGLAVGKVYMDWGRTGRLPDDVDGDRLEDILAHRPRALELMGDIEAGSVGAVLAYRQDRLARDSFTLHLMMRRARRHGVPLIIPRGDITAREQRLLTAVEGGMDEEEGTRAKERSDAAEKTMTDRGDERGAAPYGWSLMADEDGRIHKVKTDPDKPARVVDLYRSLGSYNSVARKLNADKVPPPVVPKNGKRRGSAGPPMWSAATVRGIVQREAPELATDRAAIPRRPHPRLFRGLLRCWCGAPMTASGNSRGEWYYCNRGKRAREGHGVYTVPESRIRPWIEAEAARLRDPDEYTETVGQYDDSTERRSLEAMREAIGEDAYRLALANLDAKREAAGARRERLLEVPAAIDWQRWDTEAINRALRSLWEYVELGPDLLPVRAEWREPGLRAE